MLYTVGHSTLPAGELGELLVDNEIDALIDVRSHPTSKWDQYRRSNLMTWVPSFGVAYEWWPALGGWNAAHLELTEELAAVGVDIPVYARGKFPKQRIAPARDDPDAGLAWTNQGLYDYSWFMSLPETVATLEALLRRAQVENLAVMCAEVLWWKCHRSMIADFAVWSGADAVHLQPRRKEHSAAIGNRIERYDPRVVEAWIAGAAGSELFVALPRLGGCRCD